MATVTSAAQQPIRALRNWAARPAVATALILLYLAVVLLVLRGLDRRHLWFPTFSTLAFPAFVLSPFIVMSAPISRRLKTILIGGLILIAMPLVGIYDTSYLELAIQICIFTGLALGLNIVVGFAGLLDLGYIAFFAVGAYLWAMFTSQAPTVINISGLLVPAWTFPIFLIIGVGIAAVTGILLGLPVLRLRGDYLAIVTLGFGEMIRVLARNLDQPINFTNRAQGLHNVSPPPIQEIWTSFTSSTANLMGISLPNVTPVAQQLLFYFAGVLIVAIVVVVARRLDD